MLVLTIRTDKPEAEIGLYDGTDQLTYKKWSAHRELGKTVHGQIAGLLKGCGLDWYDVEAIVAFRGPGSFTGLRIGLTLADTLAYSLGVPIVGQQGDDWIDQGLTRLGKGQTDIVVMPEYGAEANITQPRK